MFPDFMDRTNIRMVQRGSGLRFAAESFERFRSCNQIIWKKFQRDMAFEVDVFRFIHHTHSSATQLVQNAIVRNGLADHCKDFNAKAQMREVN